MYIPAAPNQFMNSFVPISRFNKGEAGKIIDEVNDQGFKIVIKNNEPVCIMVKPELFNELQERANRVMTIDDSKEAELKRKEFIKKIRARAVPPIDLKSPEERKRIMDSIGPIDIDEEAVNELRRISII